MILLFFGELRLLCGNITLFFLKRSIHRRIAFFSLFLHHNMAHFTQHHNIDKEEVSE